MDINTLAKLIRGGEGEAMEFKREITELGKTVAAFANTYGGTILVGIDDEGNIVGIPCKSEMQKISDSFPSVNPVPEVKVSTVKIEEKVVVVLQVKKGVHLYSFKNIVYIRVGRNNRPLSIQEVVEKAGESLRLFFDELLSTAPISVLNKNLIHAYLEMRETTRGIKKPAKLDDKLLLQLRILGRKNKKTAVTNGGLLFFAREPVINISRVHIVHFSDNQMQRYTDQRIFEGSLWEMANKVELYLRNTLGRVGGYHAGFKRVERFEYPIDALREAVLNAIVHRNYFDSGDVKIFIMPDSIIIKNPGAFPPGVTPKIPEHRPRNPLLAQYFYDVGLIEKYGSGIQKMKAICRQNSIMLDFELHQTSTTVIFKKRKSEFVPDKTDGIILDKLKNTSCGSRELVELTSLTRQAVIKRLNKLLRAGLIERQGSGAAVRYCLK